MESPAGDRWIIEQMLGEKNGHEWIRNDTKNSNSICPDSVGNYWKNNNKVNKNETIKVQCTNVTPPGTKNVIKFNIVGLAIKLFKRI